MKLAKKAFTLVEMLIVVVIIGILIAALVPRLTGAQERARDTARQTGLSQIGTALSVYQSDNGKFPMPADGEFCIYGSGSDNVRDVLIPAYIKSLPQDPQGVRTAYGTQDGGCTGGSFAYTPLVRNGSDQGGFVLIANTEAQGKTSNWILADTFETTLSFDHDASTPSEAPDTSSNTYIFKNVEEAEKFICDKSTVDTTATAYLASCIAKENNQMVYVKFD